MKMKDVISKTDLTDRAVRLYIENGLVAPDFGETDSGRRSLDFSEADVDSLKKIATLRKAGFSIAEIKKMKCNENCKETVLEFIEKTALKVETDTRIINSLQSLIEKDEITLDSVCQSLDAPTAEKSVPAEDLKTPKEEVFKRRFFLISGIIGAFIWIFTIVLRNMLFNQNYRFPAIQDNGVFAFRTVVSLLSLISSILLIGFNIRTKSYKKLKNGHIFKTTMISAIFLSVFLISSFVDFTNIALYIYNPDFYSMTTDHSDYLELDKEVKSYGEDIYSIFPARIPPTAFLKKTIFEEDKVKYYYQYSWNTDMQFDIEAEWPLPPEKYDEYKQKVLSNNMTITAEKQKGDWNCLYFKDSDEEAKDEYYYLIFAYNDKTNSLRYIISRYCFGNIVKKPHYFELEW